MKRLSSSIAWWKSYDAGSAFEAIESNVAITKPQVIPPMSMSTTAMSCSAEFDAETGMSP
jgi:hypothetical protein